MKTHVASAGHRLRLALLIGMLLAAGLATSQTAAAFDDVEPGRFYEDPINWMADQGVTTGRTPTIFDPDANVTRGEVATFVWRLAFEPTPASESGFTDVEAGRFYEDPINWMAETEITTGRTPTIFDPDAPVTRGEVVTFLWRFMCEPEPSESSGFDDVEAGRFYTTPVDWAAEEGITTGRTPTIFDPNAAVTRGEVATFVWRLAGEPDVGEVGENRVTLAPDCDGTPPPPPPGVGDLDVTASVDFGDLGVNVGGDATITLENDGASGSPRITVTGISSSDGSLTVDFTPVSIEPGDSVDVPISLTPAELGEFEGTLTVLHNGDNGPETEVDVTADGVPGAVHKINAGGPAVGDWTADPDGDPSELHNMMGTEDVAFVSEDAISGEGSVPEAVYQGVRTDHPSSRRMEWDLPVPAAGYYRITLHFAEVQGDTQRVFDVELEGETVLRDFSPRTEAGGPDAAVTRTFVVMADESIDLDFDHSVGLKPTSINGIEVESLGTAPDGFVSVTPALADAGSVAVSSGDVDVDVTVTNLGSSSVSIPSVAPTGDFSTNKGSLTIPGGDSDTFTITFDPSSEGVQTQWLELNSTSGDAGVQLVGFGGEDTGATLNVLPSFTFVDATIIDKGAIQIRNTSATAEITSLTFDLSGALVDDLFFDVDDGDDIAVLNKDFTSDFSPIEITSQTDDARTLTVSLTGFEPGQTLFASVDVDPQSTTGENSPTFPKAATVDGLELVGTTVTIGFSDATTRTATLWNDGVHAADSFGFAEDGVKPAAPTITEGSGLSDGDSTTDATGRSIDVVCTTGNTVTLLHVEAELLITAGASGAGSPVGGNRILDHVGVGTFTDTCAGGAASFDLDTLHGADGLFDTTPDDDADGWNHFMVLEGDPSTGVVSASNRLSIQYDSTS